MEKVSAWLFLLIAVVLLLGLVGLDLGAIGTWIATIALAAAAIVEIAKGK